MTLSTFSWIVVVLLSAASLVCSFRTNSLIQKPLLNNNIPYRSSNSKIGVRLYQHTLSHNPSVSTITSSSQYLQHDSKGKKPESALSLAVTNFGRDLKDILKEIKLYTLGKKNIDQELPESLGLTLSNEGVKRTEERRIMNGGRVDAHPVAYTLYEIGCKMLDLFYDGRPLERFWFLETIARIPYFVYVSALHLYESLGWWREPTLRKIHAAEEWNEMHHLLIMESLGGNKVNYQK